MAIKIASCPTFEIAADKIIQAWRDAGGPKIIRLEGFEGVGKTGLAKLVKERFGVSMLLATIS